MPQPPYPTHHWTRGCVDPRTSLDAEVRQQACAFRWVSNLDSPVTQSVPQARFTYHTDWATPAVTFANMELVTTVMGRHS